MNLKMKAISRNLIYNSRQPDRKIRLHKIVHYQGEIITHRRLGMTRHNLNQQKTIKMSI